jgi:hypothetical protein
MISENVSSQRPVLQVKSLVPVQSWKYKAIGTNNIIIPENLFNGRVEDIFP